MIFINSSMSIANLIWRGKIGRTDFPVDITGALQKGKLLNFKWVQRRAD